MSRYYNLIWTHCRTIEQFKKDEQYWDGAMFTMSFGGDTGLQDALAELERRVNIVTKQDIERKGCCDFILSCLTSN